VDGESSERQSVQCALDDAVALYVQPSTWSGVRPLWPVRPLHWPSQPHLQLYCLLGRVV